MSRSTSRDAALFDRLAAETDESAAVRLFLDLCRSSPELRHWLWEDFAKDSAKRAHLARLLKRLSADPARFAELNGESDLWREEARRLRAQLPRRPYGGRTFAEIKERLIRHQAGSADTAAFLFALEWQRLRRAGRSPRLLRGAFELLDALMRSPNGQLARQLEDARALAQAFSSGRRRAAVGYADWWKVNVLTYVLRHPAPAYRLRDLHAYLAEHGLNVSARLLRRFCTDVGLKRDVRAGRPTGAKDRHERQRRRTRHASARSTASELHRP